MSLKADILDKIESFVNGVVVDGEEITAQASWVDVVEVKNRLPVFSVMDFPENISIGLSGIHFDRKFVVGISGWAFANKNKPRKGVDIIEAIISQFALPVNIAALESLNGGCGASIVSIGPINQETFQGTEAGLGKNELLFMSIQLEVEFST